MKKRVLAVAAVVWALALVAVASSTLTMLITGTAGSAGSRAITDEELEFLDRYQRLDEVRGIIDESYYTEVDEEVLVQGAIDGMLASLDDPYTFYYTAEDMLDRRESTTGEYKGVGMSVQMDGNGFITVVRVFEDSPADRGGILSGDTLIAIDGEMLNIQSAKDLDEAVTRIRGVENTDVKLTVIRGEEELEFTVTRGDVSINYVEYQLIDDVGYIHIYEFEGTTAASFHKAVEYFREQNVAGVIIDVRDNPGGMLDSVVEIADTLVPKGRVIYTEDRAGNVTSYYSSDSYWGIPLVMLINGNSASASEILAAAVQDYGMGTIMGTTSYGKGIVQLLMAFDDGAGMQFTESTYYTPSGRCIHGTGVDPDIVVELSEDYDPSIRGVDLENDNQLAAAMDEVHALAESAAAEQ